ncbi:MAG: response regulator [bacterium]|nr:response regulator [bacterium]
MERPLTVLVVDDEPHIRLLMKTVLEGRGLRVLTAEDGRRGHELVISLAPDLVLLDWEMPGVGGEDFLALLGADGNATPVMVITGSADVSGVADFPQVVDFLAKPFDVWELADRVDRLLER